MAYLRMTKPIARIPEAGSGTADMRTGEPNIPFWRAMPDVRERLRTGGEGYQTFRNIALSEPGKSPWEQMMMERQATEEAQARDLTQKQSAGAKQSAWNMLAMRGGGGAGARERLLNAPGNFDAMQNIARQGRLARADIGLRGEEQRLGMLGQLPGMEYQRELGSEALRQTDYENLLKRYALLKKDWAAQKMGEEILK
jgi:hypothetical protein